jgi:hypothetical protein
MQAAAKQDTITCWAATGGVAVEVAFGVAWG